MQKNIQIALAGNPNSGKSSLFNALTGLSQKVGNFPGVTVEKKIGSLQLEEATATIIDIPGSYSLYPRREDEWVAYKVLMGLDEEVSPSLMVVAIDASNLKRNLLFLTQLMDLKIPVIAAITMMDIAEKKGIEVDVIKLQQQMGIPMVVVNPRKNKGLQTLKKIISQTIKLQHNIGKDYFIDVNALLPTGVQTLPLENSYRNLHFLSNYKSLQESNLVNEFKKIDEATHFSPSKAQAQEVIQRYQKIGVIMQKCVKEPSPQEKKIFTDKLDNILLHRVGGYFILLLVLFILFQSVFWLAQFPMDGIEWTFKALTTKLHNKMQDNLFTSFLLNGIIAGLSGILVFVPQIMILFGLITMLEDTGYMARISFLSDKLMRKVGLNGKSVMPMISGFACAVPAIMSARNIENSKERFLTIFITPLMSCSARLPVFTILISLVIPNNYYFGFLSLQGLVMMALYLLGIAIALFTSFILNLFIKAKEKSFFILELPVYRAPRWKNVLVTMVQKAKIFVVDAGKVIMIISLLLWFLSAYGPSNNMQKVDEKFITLIAQQPAQKAELEKQWSADKLQQSYIGRIGAFIQPAITPLGYDWKIGIAIITSFAAREVFVGTMATLYSVEDDNDSGLREKLYAAKHSNGKPVYTLASALSLMIFYVLALQCMSTLAIVKRETNSWKIPALQFIYMTGLAYILSLLVYQLFK
ncbi:MAG: ferrous iron transport protein B [Chitinophagaceae bacterium]